VRRQQSSSPGNPIQGGICAGNERHKTVNHHQILQSSQKLSREMNLIIWDMDNPGREIDDPCWRMKDPFWEITDPHWDVNDHTWNVKDPRMIMTFPAGKYQIPGQK
jgi:hypothetical protein